MKAIILFTLRDVELKSFLGPSLIRFSDDFDSVKEKSVIGSPGYFVSSSRFPHLMDAISDLLVDGKGKGWGDEERWHYDVYPLSEKEFKLLRSIVILMHVKYHSFNEEITPIERKMLSLFSGKRYDELLILLLSEVWRDMLRKRRSKTLLRVGG